MVDFSGTFLPVTTPFDPVTGDVDVIAFRANLRHWFQNPIRGILVAGSTGESVFLDEQERVERLLELVWQIQARFEKPPTCGPCCHGSCDDDGDVDHLKRPRGVRTDLDGNLYVADYANYRVQKFVPKPDADPRRLIQPAFVSVNTPLN